MFADSQPIKVDRGYIDIPTLFRVSEFSDLSIENSVLYDLSASAKFSPQNENRSASISAVIAGRSMNIFGHSLTRGNAADQMAAETLLGNACVMHYS